MQQNFSKTRGCRTPCRRLGLRRLCGGGPFNAGLTSTPESNKSFEDNGIPRSCNDTTKTDIKKNPQSGAIFCDASVLLSEREVPVKETDSHNIVENTLKRADRNIQQCENSNFADSNSSNAKKLKIDYTNTTPSIADFNILKWRVDLKEKKLKELLQADIFRTKHDPGELKICIQTWLQACQEALQELLKMINIRGCQTNMKKLLQELKIPASLVHYNLDTEDFE